MNIEQDITQLSKYMTQTKVLIPDEEIIKHYSQFGILQISIDLDTLSVEAKIDPNYTWIFKT